MVVHRPVAGFVVDCPVSRLEVDCLINNVQYGVDIISLVDDFVRFDDVDRLLPDVLHALECVDVSDLINLEGRDLDS